MARRPIVLLALPRYRGTNHALFLGIAGLAASLHEAGIDVAVLDEDVAGQAEEQTGVDASEVVRRVIDSVQPDVIGLHVNTPNYAAALSLARLLRSHSQAVLVAGGPHAGLAAGTVLARHPEIDLVLRGEADGTLPALVHALAANGSLDAVPGLSRRLEGRITHNPRGSLLGLDEMPRPDRLALLAPPDPVLRKYARATYARNFYSTIPGFSGREVASAYASRGCGSCCGFCFPSAFWAEPSSGLPTRRLRPVAAVLAELRDVRDLGYGAVFFDEPTFPMASSPDWLRVFCAGVRDLGLRWGAPTRLDEIDRRLIPDLARAGLRYIYYGQETPLESLQRRIEKLVDPAKAVDVINCLGAHGIQCDVSLQFGAPGETDDTINATLAWMDRALPRGNAFFSVAAIWPGTEWAQSFGLGTEFWEPDFDRTEVECQGVVWYPEGATSIERFYSNSTGTYHPAFMTVERALSIKERILGSGFRDRFGRFSRARPAGVETSP